MTTIGVRVAALSPDARALYELLPGEWKAGGLRKGDLTHALGWADAGGQGPPATATRARVAWRAARRRFADAVAELVAAGLAEHRGGGCYGRTLAAITATKIGSRGESQ